MTTVQPCVVRVTVMMRPVASVRLADATAPPPPAFDVLDDMLTDDRDEPLPAEAAEAEPCEADVETPKSAGRPTPVSVRPSPRWRITRQLSSAGAAAAAVASIAAAVAPSKRGADVMMQPATGAAGPAGGANLIA